MLVKNTTMDFTKFPFGVPDRSSRGKLINAILSTSFQFQKKCGVTNQCHCVNPILHECFRIAGIESDIVYGFIHFGSGKTLHVWLEIDGHTIDNTYIKRWSVSTTIRRLSNSNYRKIGTEPSTGYEPLRIKSLTEISETLCQWQDKNKDKWMLLSTNNINILLYFLDMKRYLENDLKLIGLVLPGNEACWACSSTTVPLKHCATCKEAKYCSKVCQRQDWKKYHKEVCVGLWTLNH